MTEKKEKWEIGYSNEKFPVEPGVGPVSIGSFKGLSGELLDGRFLIEKDLTESGADAGGIGLVYLARDMKLMGREVVVKILQKEALQSEDMLRKFQHEKEALIRLDHPNIVRILDSGTLSDGNPFTVMEYISGRSLRRLLRDGGPLSLDLAFGIKNNVSRSWRTARKLAGLVDLRLEDHRHTFVTRLDRGGFTQAEIAHLLGHQQVHSTFRHTDPERELPDTVKSTLNAKWKGICRRLAPVTFLQIPTPEYEPEWEVTKI